MKGSKGATTTSFIAYSLVAYDSTVLAQAVSPITRDFPEYFKYLSKCGLYVRKVLEKISEKKINHKKTFLHKRYVPLLFTLPSLYYTLTTFT